MTMQTDDKIKRATDTAVDKAHDAADQAGRKVAETAGAAPSQPKVAHPTHALPRVQATGRARPFAGWLEDLEVGAYIELGRETFTKENIVEFASQFDPQPFHVDEEVARHGLFGGLCASRWQTRALALRMMCAAYLPELARLGSPRTDHLRRLQPGFPGHVLRLLIAIDPAAVPRDANLTERLRGARKLRIGTQDLLIGDALDLKATRRKPQRPERDEVVAVAPGVHRHADRGVQMKAGDGGAVLARDSIGNGAAPLRQVPSAVMH